MNWHLAVSAGAVTAAVMCAGGMLITIFRWADARDNNRPTDKLSANMTALAFFAVIFVAIAAGAQ